MMNLLFLLLLAFCIPSTQPLTDKDTLPERRPAYTIGTVLKESGDITATETILTKNHVTAGKRTVLKQSRDTIRKGKLIYQHSFCCDSGMQGWVMEGPGALKFRSGWMEMFSPEKKWDHVFWCPEDFPAAFIAEWEIQNLDTSEGLVIVFFSAKGNNGQDIFDQDLPARDGTFKYYNKGAINCYHISYYANNPKNPEREGANLRKDPMFALLQKGEDGIPKNSADIHKVRLVKNDSRIIMYVDERKIIDYIDEGTSDGPVYGSGKIGFRQMRWSHFRYRDFKVWTVRD